ncbi:hypothetical protein [Haladaptatus halobius]|nr:hypothetical protein [Haladaptatus halobius]
MIATLPEPTTSTVDEAVGAAQSAKPIGRDDRRKSAVTSSAISWL